MSEQPKQVGILLIATRKYKQFLPAIIDGIAKNFLPHHERTIFIFNDDYEECLRLLSTTNPGCKITASFAQIPPYGFPQATLYRYKIFDEHKERLSKMDYLFYLDVDMAIVDTVGDEILIPELLCVRHPGFYKNGGWGSGGNSPQSLSYLPTEKRTHYFAGGFQGGRADKYLQACNILHARILDDESRKVMAEWHDEAHWNWLLNSGQTGLQYKSFTPEYCMVEQDNLRKLWGIDNLKPKIVALAKDHKSIRE